MLRKSAGKLFLKFLAFLIPVFLLLSAVGLATISRFEMRADSAELTSRVGNLAARISTALGRRTAQEIAAIGDDFVGAMMSDPSVLCAEVRFANEPPRVRAPRVVGCTNSGEAQQLDLPFGNAGGVLTVRFSTQELEASGNRRTILLIVTLLGSLFAAVFAGAVGFRQVIGLPLSRLREAIAESSASGKPAPVDYRGADEMGGVIAAYNELQLRHQKAEESFRSEASLRQMEEKRRADAERMASRIDEFRNDIVAIAAQLSERVIAMSQVSKRLDQSASGMASDVGTVEQEGKQSVATTTALVGASQQLMTMSEQIGQHAINTRMAGEAVHEARATMQQRVEGLSAAVSRIAELSGLIGRIASQTNLLALNATIEAARAGEAGRGFAVVASEVKNLALSTANATVQIGEAVAAIETGVKGAAAATSSLSDAGELIDEASSAIVGALKAQNQEIESINEAARASAESAQTAASSLRQFLQVAGRTEQDAGDVAAASDAIKAANRNLRHAVDRFLQELAA